MKSKYLYCLAAIFVLLFAILPADAATYTSQYPPAQNATYVGATTSLSGSFQPWFTTDPSKSLTGLYTNNQWLSSASPNRFNIDLGSAKIIRRVYYQNSHSSGTATTSGVKDYTMYGSNSSAAFADTSYIGTAGWDLLTTNTTQMVQHVAADVSDPQYINVSNAVAYRYYSFKFANNYAADVNMGVRRIELQTEDGYGPISANFTVNVTSGLFPLSAGFTDTSSGTITSFNWSTYPTGGTISSPFATTENASYLYSTGGNYTVNLTVTGTSGSSTKIQYVNVYNSTTAGFSANVTAGLGPLAVQFTDSSTNATAWYWEFGDGNTSTLQSPAFQYNISGTYDVKLNASNAYSYDWENKTAYIGVYDTLYSITANANATPSSGLIPLIVQFVDMSNYFNSTPATYLWTFGDGNTSTSRNASHTYVTGGLYNVSFAVSNTTLGLTSTKYLLVNATIPSGFNEQDITMDPTYSVRLRFTDSTTSAPIVGAVVVLNSLSNTTDSSGYAYFSSGYGLAVFSASASGYYGTSGSFVVDENIDRVYQMVPIDTTSLNNNVIYQAQLYRFMFKNLIGTSLGNLSVRITPINLTMNSSWTSQLMGISPNVNIQNGVLTGVTGYDGSFGCPLITPMSYYVNVSGTAFSGDTVNYSFIEYPPSTQTDIIINLPTDLTTFPQLTPTPAFISYNLFNQSINATGEIISVNYHDPTGATNLTIVTVSNQSGHIFNRTVYTGAAASNIVDNYTYYSGITSPPGDSLSYGFSAYVPTAGGWNNISQSLVFNSGAPFTGSATYNGWIAIILIVFVASAFTASTVYIGTVGVGLMGIFFYYGVKWFTPMVPGTAFIAMCCFWICIGAIGFIMKKTRTVF